MSKCYFYCLFVMHCIIQRQWKFHFERYFSNKIYHQIWYLLNNYCNSIAVTFKLKYEYNHNLLQHEWFWLRRVLILLVLTTTRNLRESETLGPAGLNLLPSSSSDNTLTTTIRQTTTTATNRAWHTPELSVLMTVSSVGRETERGTGKQR